MNGNDYGLGSNYGRNYDYGCKSKMDGVDEMMFYVEDANEVACQVLSCRMKMEAISYLIPFK
jgi:hypothetical protein